MASKLIHPDNWGAYSFMEILKNLSQAINERYNVTRTRYTVSFSAPRTYQYYLRLISRCLKYNVSRWYNHVRGVSHVQGTNFFNWQTVGWTIQDMLDDIGDTDFYDYDLGWDRRFPRRGQPGAGNGGLAIGFDSYRDKKYVLRQYYEMIVRMKEAIILLQGNFSEGGNDFFHSWRDDGVYHKISMDSSSSVANGSRTISWEGRGIHQKGSTSSPSLILWVWPDGTASGPPLKADHDTLYSNLYQWLPVNGYGDTMVTAPGSWPSAPFFTRLNYCEFRARAQGLDGTNGNPLEKHGQTAAYRANRITVDYDFNKGVFNSLEGQPQSLKYFYTCHHEPGPDTLGCPWQDGETGFYEFDLSSSPSVDFLFGENTSRPASIDIPMPAEGGPWGPYNGYILYDSADENYFVEVWDNGQDGGLEFYEAA